MEAGKQGLIWVRKDLGYYFLYDISTLVYDEDFKSGNAMIWAAL